MIHVVSNRLKRTFIMQSNEIVVNAEQLPRDELIREDTTKKPKDRILNRSQQALANIHKRLEYYRQNPNELGTLHRKIGECVWYSLKFHVHLC